MEDAIVCLSKSNLSYPRLLHELPERAQPKSLFVRGSLPPPDAYAIAIVGTRHATSYGKEATQDIVRALAPHNVVIVSGLALGIDGIAHRTALEEKLSTIAVLGSGISNSTIYPREHARLAEDIIKSNGAVISEYEPDAKAARWTFPERNRIIAGIARATIVIEADEKSGARITARFALEYGRDVFAIPGSIYQPESRGTNLLIKEGAMPIIDPKRVAEDLGLIEPTFEIKPQQTDNSEATDTEKKILAVLSEPLTLDDIIQKTALDTHIVSASVTELEIRGMIKSIGGTLYRKN